jgi:hypothetical protein
MDRLRMTKAPGASSTTLASPSSMQTMTGSASSLGGRVGLGTMRVSILSPRKARDGAGIEINIPQVAVAEMHFFVSNMTQAHRDAAFHLVGGSLRLTT